MTLLKLFFDVRRRIIGSDGRNTADALAEHGENGRASESLNPLQLPRGSHKHFADPHKVPNERRHGQKNERQRYYRCYQGPPD